MRKLSAAIEERQRRARVVLAFDDAVAEAVARLKEKGFDSPYLKNFVVARVNPLRFMKGGAPPIRRALRDHDQAGAGHGPGARSRARTWRGAGVGARRRGSDAGLGLVHGVACCSGPSGSGPGLSPFDARNSGFMSFEA